MKEAIPIYLEQSAKERAFLQVFGAGFDDTIEQAIQQRGFEHPIPLGRKVWDIYRGRFVEEPAAVGQKQTARILNNLASASLLGFQTAIIQASQYAQLIGKFGLRRVAQGLARVAFRGGRVEAERAGAFLKSLVNEYVRVQKLPPTATGADVLEQLSGRLASGVIRRTGVQWMDEFPRAVGYHAARFSIQDAIEAAALSNRQAVAMLRQVGLTPTATAQEIAETAANLSQTINVTARFSSLPHILQTPIGSFARGLNTFNIQITRMIVRQFIQPALRGNVAPLMRFLGSGMIIGEGIGEVRRGIAGRRGDRPGGTIEEFLGDVVNGRVPDRVVIARAVDNLAWLGTMGIAQSMYQGMLFRLSGREAGARAASSLLGAGVSSALEVGFGLPAGLAQAALAKDEEARRRALQTTGRVAIRRVPGVGGVIAPRVLRSEFADRRVAVQAAARALQRGDQERARRVAAEFERRHGKSLSQQSIDKEIDRLQGGTRVISSTAKRLLDLTRR